MTTPLTRRRLLTAAQVAELTTLKPSTLRAWRSTGRKDVPQGFKLGGRVVWDEADVLAWIEAQAASGAS